MSFSVAEQTQPFPVRCLVIQLARLGDTLQSLMALKAAKQLYPQLEIHFLARERFADAARRIDWIEEVITLPTDDLLKPYMTGEKNQTEALIELSEWIQPLVNEPWDLLLNWSYSEASSYLTAILPAAIKLGYTRSKDRQLSCADGWSHYMQAIVQGKVDQNIHLTDIFTTQLLTALQIHVGDPADVGELPVNSKGFFTSSPVTHSFLSQWRESTKKWIALQLGAGREDKTWPAERFADLAQLIISRHSDWNIVLLGGAEDQAREKEFFACLKNRISDPSRIVSLVGQTQFDLWTSVVSKVHWVIAADTSVIHLASVLGTRVLNLSIGPVQWSETGPYGNGHLIVATSDQSLPEPEWIYGVWSHALTERTQMIDKDLSKHLVQQGCGDALDVVKVMKSRIRPTQDGGGVVYEPLTSHSLELREWSSTVMGQIARAWFCGWVAPIGHELRRDVISPELIIELRKLSETSNVLEKICIEAEKASNELIRKSKKLRSEKLMKLEDRQVIESIGMKMQELDKLIERVGNSQTPLRAFSQMARVMMHNLAGDNLLEVGKEGATCYKNLKEGVKIFKDWVDFTLNMAKPRAVKSDLSKITPIQNPN